MRKTISVAISLSLALGIVLLCAAMRTSAVTTPQSVHFIWVPVEGDQSRPGFKRVVGGTHDDGTTMYICRVSGLTPGKLYNNTCHYSYVGQEYAVPSRYQILLTDSGYEWKSFDEVKRS